jgi:hypothetical protein
VFAFETAGTRVRDGLDEDFPAIEAEMFRVSKKI